MVALDTNILVYAADRASPFHLPARELVTGLAERPEPWALPWPCIYEFLRTITGRAITPPMPPDLAWANAQGLIQSPGARLLSETQRHAAVLEQVLRDSGATGSLLHDAHIAALCIEHGVSELVTADRDFRRFRGLRIHDPFHD